MSNKKQIYIQKDGAGKGTEVELVKDKANTLVLKNLKLGFEYNVSRQAFDKHYTKKIEK
jgi:hypothetical protein